MIYISENNAVSDITTNLSHTEPELSRLQPCRAQLLRHHQLRGYQALDLPVGNMAAQGVALVEQRTFHAELLFCAQGQSTRGDAQI
jgi:hypothetical protein